MQPLMIVLITLTQKVNLWLLTFYSKKLISYYHVLQIRNERYIADSMGL